MDLELLETRGLILREVRAFFDGRGYLPVDTPLLSPDLIPESCLEVFETALLPPSGSRRARQSLYLVPSPEIWMKKLIARHRVSMYQICKCFRNGESRGRNHSPEFTMLEYYTMDADYLDSLAITEALFRYVEAALGGFSSAAPAASTTSAAAGGPAMAAPARFETPFLRISMEEAFVRWAGFSLAEVSVQGAAAMEKAARKTGLEPPPGLDTAALFDLVFIHAVEPNLPKDRAVAIMDYPAFVPCLAQDGPVYGEYRTKERWELYVKGIELVNCYSEETGPEKVRAFFASEQAEKEKTALVKHAVDPAYWKLFAEGQGFPRCSGAAMGLDRFIMALTGTSSIDGILPFSV